MEFNRVYSECAHAVTGTDYVMRVNKKIQYDFNFNE